MIKMAYLPVRQRNKQRRAKMKILIADKLAKRSIEKLEQLGCIITNQPELKAEDIPSVISNYEILVVRSTKVTKETIDVADKLALIIRAGAGVNTIDLNAASDKGIHVANCPGKNADAVAELAIGLLISADRRIPAADAAIKKGAWLKKEFGKARGLKGRTLGIIGLGNIGKKVIEKAKGMEMNIVAWSRSLTLEKAKLLGIEFAESPIDVAKISDAISLHLAAKPETKHFINENFFNEMKEGAIFVNTARGEIVDTEKLKNAIKNKNLRVALDVFENEPKGGKADFTDNELAELAICTPHIGASTEQSSEAIADEVVAIVEKYISTGFPLNAVNIREKTVAKFNLVVRHYNKAGVLANILDLLKEQHINIEEMQNSIFEGGKAATCNLKLDDCPSKNLIEQMNKCDDIIKIVLQK